MARSRSSSRHTNGSRGTQLVANGNGPNGAPTPSIQPAASTRSGEDMRAQLTNHRSSGAPPPPPVAPAPARALIREGVAVFEQASTVLARVAVGLRAEEQAALGATGGAPASPPPPPTRRRSGPSTRPPQARVTQGEVNSPRPSERRGRGDSRRDRQRDDDGRAPTQTRPALERLGDRVPARERLGPRPTANEPPPAESCSRRQARQ
ncbi:PREDICTED: vasodilator-stimulated phosphoprotein-like [Ipomoea nil]|uniref:vasodilator-stimulated phosphoprotein-like n=1 Tax=Ipomoea nil TaxID=35883 RepID=UPI000900F6D2|nr:PREDICTED: vasodilator-stimulated phosphoprotein-like [Ipomoea nil]